MTPYSALPVDSAYKLLGFILKNETTSPLRIIAREEAIVPAETYIKNLKPEQLIASMAFRTFGLEALPANYSNNQVTYLKNYINSYPHEAGYNNQPDAFTYATQLLRKFKQDDEIAEKGEIYKNNVSEYRSELGTNLEYEDIISFSKVMGDKEILIAYNTSDIEAKERFILMHTNAMPNRAEINTVYGYAPCGHVHLFRSILNGKDISYIKIYLKPLQLVVLKNY